MADRAFERALHEASATASARHEAADPSRRQERARKAEEEELRKLDTGMTAGDAIKRILLAAKDKDYFRCSGVVGRCARRLRKRKLHFLILFLPARRPHPPPAAAPPRRLLELPPPELDALGRAAWDLGPAAVSKAYRRLSVLVHPDKNPGEEARQAFEALNEAHRMLKDPSKLVSSNA